MVFGEANWNHKEAGIRFIMSEEIKITSQFGGLDFVEKYNVLPYVLKNISYTCGVKYLDLTCLFCI